MRRSLDGEMLLGFLALAVELNDKNRINLPIRMK
jgi:hypothetical protein